VSDSKLRILVVEDQVDTAYGLKMYFDGKGHEVSVAMDVRSALAAAAEKPFDILLCDLALPDGNGWDLLRQLRLQGPVRAIAISGYSSAEDLARSEAAGFLMHLAKPVAMAELDRVFAEVMQSGQSPPADPESPSSTASPE
jgi:CheY-like chemotaxis protein